MFEPLPARFSFPEAEERVLEFWEKHDVFGKSLEQRRGAPRFVFYEGPPTANGLPHPGHCLTRAMKDLFPRYQTMCGKLVERKAGWDTHGLPVEVEVCKELGIHTKDEIEGYGVENFVRKCIESVFRYVNEWEQMTRRLGFWIKLEDAYVTFHQSYVESVWWSLKTLFERGLLYQGHKVVWWWAQGGTALSAGEVGEGYRTVQDPSVYIRFPLVEEATQRRSDGTTKGRREGGTKEEEPRASARAALRNESGTAAEQPRGLKSAAPHEDLDPSKPVSLLAWTTTPWTLIGNHFAAVGPDIDYALVHDKTTDEHLYIAASLVDDVAQKVKHDLEVVSTCKGTDLVGLHYIPPFDTFYTLRKPPPGGIMPFGSVEYYQAANAAAADAPLGQTRTSLLNGALEYVGWRVIEADFVDITTGTGIVHIAPAYGEVDFDRLQQERERFAPHSQVPLLNAVEPDGAFAPFAPAAYRGRWVKDCDEEIMQELKERGVLLHQEMIEHEYPFCPRSEEDPLIQYARKSWFVRTSQFKEEFLKNNAGIYWLPEHIREGRFGDFLRNNVDWALSRERYWGTPLPIWVCEETRKMEAIGSYAELLAKPGVQGTEVWEQAKRGNPGLSEHLKVHKPYIDAITYDSPFDQEEEPRASARAARADEGGFATGQPRGLKSAAPRARMRRVSEVIDCWWDAGSMPFAQWGFPHVEGSVETFAERFPCDFISEALDQTRGWFYGMLAISTLLFHSEGSAGVSAASGSARVPPTSGSASVPPPSGSIGVPPVSGDAGLPGASGRFGVPPASSARAPVTPDLVKRARILPHWEAGGSTYYVTFRAASGELTPEERTLVLDACRHWDGQRALVHAVVVMPEHAHVLFTPLEKAPGQWWSLADLMHSIKGYTAKEINRRRGTEGVVWQREYVDRIIRSEADFQEKWTYIVTNPERRGLPEGYAWLWVEPSHASTDRRDADAPQYRRDADGPQDRREADGPQYRRDADGPQYRRDACATLAGTAYPHPYKACVVLGLMMGEDGLKMSKRKKNYKEPAYIFDHYGADAMRWFFFSGQTPWTSVRFQEATIRDAQREFLVRLYNVFSFFNIYANIDGFDPGTSDEATLRQSSGQVPRRSDEGDEEPRASARAAASAWRPVPQRSELDRWIIGEMHRTIGDVRAAMDRFENYPAAGRLNGFVDALSNWYVRRSRERFWRPLLGSVGVSPADQDKWDAYHTLHEVLVALSKLIAPFTPFFAETMYQNLTGGEALRGQGAKGSRVRGFEGSSSQGVEGAQPSDPQTLEPSKPSPLSVHLCDYPVAEEGLIDEELAQEMDLVRQIVSLGRAARTAARLKVRQPLARAEIILARREHTAWLEAHSALIAEELNIKRVEFTTEADHYVTHQVKPEFKAIGPKFGKLAPRLAAALGQMDAAEARRTLTASGELVLEVDGQPVRLTSHEVQVRLEAKPGWSAAQGRAGVVVVKTELTEELVDEGLIREVIHHVQGIRKDLSLRYEQRIDLGVETTAKLENTIKRFANTIRRECLVEEIGLGDASTGEVREVTIEGQPAKLSVKPR